jgi:transposase
MGKHATLCQKVAFLVHLEYVNCAEAARRADITYRTILDIKNRAGELCIERAKQGLPLPSYEEQVARKEGSGAQPKISKAEIEQLLEACTTNKKQRKKL